MNAPDYQPLDVDRPLWEQCYTVAPVVLIGTREEDGYDFAPKHMVTPLGWDNLFGFVCTPRHRTYHNVKATGVFTVSVPWADQAELVGRAAAPRAEGARKAVMDSIPTMPARAVDGVLLRDAALQLECRLDRRVDRLGGHSLVIGLVVAARAHPDLLRGASPGARPLLVYVAPDRYAAVDRTHPFPFPRAFDERAAFPRTEYLQALDDARARADPEAAQPEARASGRASAREG